MSTLALNAVTQNFNPGDIGYIKRAYGHYIRNTGNTDLVYLEVFRSSHARCQRLPAGRCSLVVVSRKVTRRCVRTLPLTISTRASRSA